MTSEKLMHGIREIARLAADRAFPCTCGDDYVAATLSHRRECPILPEAQFQKVWIACEEAAKAVVEECAKMADEYHWNNGYGLASRIRALAAQGTGAEKSGG